MLPPANKSRQLQRRSGVSINHIPWKPPPGILLLLLLLNHRSTFSTGHCRPTPTSLVASWRSLLADADMPSQRHHSPPLTKLARPQYPNSIRTASNSTQQLRLNLPVLPTRTIGSHALALIASNSRRAPTSICNLGSYSPGCMGRADAGFEVHAQHPLPGTWDRRLHLPWQGVTSLLGLAPSGHQGQVIRAA